MSRHAAIFALIAASMVLSGCLSGQGGGSLEASSSDAPQEPSPSSTPSSSSSSTSSVPTSASPDNQAPTAVLSVRDGETELDLENGTYAVETAGNVTFDASGSSDADKDPLSFAWTVDGETDDSTEDTLTLELENGFHVVSVSVSDGTDAADAEVQVQVGPVEVAASPSGELVTVTEFTGKFVRGDGAAKAVTHPVVVPAGTQQISVWLTWNDHATENSPNIVDLDLFVLDAAQEEALAVESSDFEYGVVKGEGAPLAAGTWGVKVVPFGAAATTTGASTTGIPADVDYNVQVLAWAVAPTVTEVTGTVQGGVNVGSGSSQTSPTVTGVKNHELTLPEGVTTVTARLTWSNAASAQAASTVRRSHDFDLVVEAAGARQFSSGNFGAFEFGHKDGDAADPLPGGVWKFIVVPFTVPAADYKLVIEYA